MRAADATIKFGEWLPDLDAMDNPGLLEASGVLPVADGYAPYAPLTDALPALAARPLGAIQTVTPGGDVYIWYAGTDTALYEVLSSSIADRSDTTYSAAAGLYWRFVQFDDWMVAINNQHAPRVKDIDVVGNFAVLATTGTAPTAREGGVIGRFLLLGNTVSGGRYHLQWSAIDDPRNWPTPGTATAATLQAGDQSMKAYLGPITRIVGGDQFGIVMQRGGLTRVTYVGPPVVFQFDEFDVGHGCYWPNSVVQIGGIAYYAGLTAFFATDGVRVDKIGEFKVDNRFDSIADTAFSTRMYGAHDPTKKLIYWSIPTTTSTSGRPNRLLIYNYDLKRWGEATQDMEVLTTPNRTGDDRMLAFSSTNVPGYFTGAPTTAILTTGERELFPGRYARIQGIKPLVSGTSPTVTVAMGSRNSQGSSVTYTSEVTPTSRTGFADFRSPEARFFRSRTTISGDFGRATGIEVQAARGGAA